MTFIYQPYLFPIVLGEDADACTLHPRVRVIYFFYVRVCVCVKLHQGALELLMSLLSAGTGVSTRWLLSPEYC